MTWVAPLGALILGCRPAPVEPVVEHPDAAFMAAGGAAEDVWLVGAQPDPTAEPVVLRGRDGQFELVPTGQLHPLWWVHAFDSGETFLAGDGATILRHPGGDGAIERMPTPGFALQTVYGIWGASPDDLWAVGGFAGRDAFAWRYDGEAWTEVALPDDLPRTSQGEIPSLFKVWGRSADDVWIVGGLGTILHWDGERLVRVPSGTDRPLFTVAGNDEAVFAVGGAASGVLLEGGPEGFVDITPEGAPLLQGLWAEDRTVWVAGANGWAARRRGSRDFKELDLGFDRAPASVHALWSDGADLWAVGGDVISPALDRGAVATSAGTFASWAPVPPEPPDERCPAAAIDPYPDGSVARRWVEQVLNSVRRDIPHPPVHARNLHHTAIAMFDAWAAYDDIAQGVVVDESVDVPEADRAAARGVAIAYAALRVVQHRYSEDRAIGAATSQDCYLQFMSELGLDPDDTTVAGDGPVALGNRVGQAVIDAFANDGANEANGYADTTDWSPVNPVLVVDVPGVVVDDPDEWQQLNLATAETQNGIVLEDSVQPYIGPQWREVTPFALVRDPETGLYSDPGEGAPTVDDPRIADWAVEVIQRTADLDHLDGVEIDIGPRGRGNNPLGTNDGSGYDNNPFTKEPYAPNVVPRGDFARVVAEMWADGPDSETPPGHWVKIANEVSDRLTQDELVPFGEGEAVDRLAWDVAMYLAVTGAVHDAAISAWELKRETLGPRPITIIRWMAENGQRSDPDLPSYSPDGLPLVPGLVELITEESAAPGERHHALRWYIGEIAVWSWPGEPGDRKNDFTPLRWMRAKDWIPYQRRTFVTPAFPGFTSGHSTFSRAAAEAMTEFTGSPWFPEGLHEFVAPANDTLIFEAGPSVDLRLQWAQYYDAADEAGQSRLWGGIHLWPDDEVGRINGFMAGRRAADRAREFWLGVADD